MPTITLISTMHEEIGQCNAGALHTILERARPEVIFMEIPPPSFQRVFNDEENLESRAVKRYLQAHRAEVVPVDIMEASSEIVAESQRLCRELRARSRKYFKLMSEDWQCIDKYGFAYLNSKYCVETWLEADVATREALESMGNAELSRSYKEWNDVHELREREMMKNIQSYVEAHPFNTGMFLLGAAHRRAIMDKAASLGGSVSVVIDWNFEDYEGLIDGWRVDAAAK
jgi:hypothetical protein